MFEKNLNDLVRGLRNHKTNESKYVSECLDEIKQELRQENMTIKANAVLKLSYIQMLGYDISWAAFNVIEVMSSPKFIHKRIAYMTASQSFHAEMDVLMLATNLIKKDMSSQNQYDAGSAMVGLSCFVTPDLARDLANDIMSMMVSSRPYIRKRAILLMYKVFLNFPESLRPAFPRLKEKLEDQDPGVQCAAVNVICELARKNPKNYLALAPLFFKLMTTSSNNWMLIKIIKLFGALCPLEPRLGKKLLEPLTSLIHRASSDIKKCRRERDFIMAARTLLDVTETKLVNGHSTNRLKTEESRFKLSDNGISTSAMSLLYECVNTVICGLPDHMPSMQLCVQKLRLLIEDPDQNLKYLGLLLLNKILKCQPKMVVGHRDLILQCLDDRDESIRYRALDLIVGMISKKTLVDIVKKLMVHMEKTEGTAYRDELLSKIIEICSQSNYQYITSFEWYIEVLLQLSNIEGTKYGKLIANQMLDIVIRVKAVRKHAIPMFASLLGKTSLIGNAQSKNTCYEVLFAAAWVAGEFAEFLPDIHAIVDCLIHERVTSLPGHIQCVYVQAIAKLFSRILTKSESEDGDEEEVEQMSEKLIVALSMFTQSADLEVQDRSCCVLQLIKLVIKMKKEGVKCAQDVSTLFAEELLPVAPKAQKKVPIPEGLDLDKWINEPLSESEDEDEDVKPFFSDDHTSSSHVTSFDKKHTQPDPEEVEKQKELRRMFQESNPHYLKVDATKKKEDANQITVEDIPVKELDTGISLRLNVSGKKGRKKGKKGKKGRQASESEDEPSYEVTPVVDLDDAEDGRADANENMGDPHSLLNVDLDTPLEEHEVIPVQTHRVVQEKQNQPEKLKTKKTKKSKADATKKKRSKSHDGENTVYRNRIQENTEKVPKKVKKTKKKRDQTEAEKKATLLAQASQYTKEVKNDEVEEDSEMAFWLAPAASNVSDTSPETITPAADTSSPVEQTKMEEEENTPKETKKKKKTSEKGGKEKKEKKKKKSKKSADQEPSKEVATEQSTAEDAMILDLDDTPTDSYAHYNVLCEDKNMKLLYEVRADPMQHNQIVASIIFRNLTKNHVQKLEFNVLDSLSMKLVRQMGMSPHDPVLVPFQLLPEMTNEGQFAFTVDACVMSQFLRGTLTYIIKESDGSSTSEKLDFKILFPVSVYILPQPISSHDFTALLAGGELKEKQSQKIDTPDNKNLLAIVQNICTKMRLAVVEQIDHSASLHGVTIQQHPICLLIKKTSDSVISVDGKSTDFQLLSSVLKEIKDHLTAI